MAARVYGKPLAEQVIGCCLDRTRATAISPSLAARSAARCPTRLETTEVTRERKSLKGRPNSQPNANLAGKHDLALLDVSNAF